MWCSSKAKFKDPHAGAATAGDPEVVKSDRLQAVTVWPFMARNTAGKIGICLSEFLMLDVVMHLLTKDRMYKMDYCTRNFK